MLRDTIEPWFRIRLVPFLRSLIIAIVHARTRFPCRTHIAALNAPPTGRTAPKLREHFQIEEMACVREPFGATQNDLPARDGHSLLIGICALTKNCCLRKFLLLKFCWCWERRLFWKSGNCSRSFEAAPGLAFVIVCELVFSLGGWCVFDWDFWIVR